MKAELSQTIQKIERWFIDRNLHCANPHAQITKLFEEGGELAGGVARENNAVVKDSIGDMVVVLVGLCTQLDVDFQECVELAYNEIKDRRGKLVNGIFIKEEDLQDE